MSRKWFVLTILGVFFASFLAACSESGEEDPYALVTLKEATYGQVVSKNFKYKFKNPQVVATYRNLGLIRDGSQIEIIAARSLADKLEGFTDGELELAVAKKFSPYVYFKVERIVANGDTTFPAQAGGIAYPVITSAEEYGVDGYEERDIDDIPYNRTGTIRALKDKKIRVSGPIVTEKSEGRTIYYIEGKGAKFRIADPTEPVGLMLNMLVANNYIFEGGIILTEPEPYSERMQNRIAGTVDIQYVMYGDRLITG
jgi:hypothetical protein